MRPSESKLNSDVVAEFYDALLDLETPEKWKIESLTEIASQQLASGYLYETVHAIEQRIAAAQSKHKLPVWYLLDSIVKQIGEPFKSAFSERLPRLIVDNMDFETTGLRDKYTELITLWNDTAVFPRSIFAKVEAIIEGRDPSPDPPAPASAPPAARRPAPVAPNAGPAATLRPPTTPRTAPRAGPPAAQPPYAPQPTVPAATTAVPANLTTTARAVMLGAVPGVLPGAVPGGILGAMPGALPGAVLDALPGAMPGVPSVMPGVPLMPPPWMFMTPFGGLAGPAGPPDRRQRGAVQSIKDLLYSSRFVCDVCALRFTSAAALASHKDTHVVSVFNSAAISRRWLLSTAGWAELHCREQYESVAPLAEILEQKEPEVENKKRKREDVLDTADVVLSFGDAGDYRCQACHEPLRKYQNAKDEWTLEDSFLLDPGPPVVVCHKGCRVFLTDLPQDKMPRL